MKKLGLTGWILIAMAAGIIAGLSLHETLSPASITSLASSISIVTDIFLRLIKMIIAPLVFCTLVVGIAKLGDLKTVGRVGGKTLLWFLCASFLSLLLGLVIMNVTKLGTSLHLTVPDAVSSAGVEKQAISFRNFIAHVFPESVVEAMATNSILQIVVFAILFGVATAAIGEQGKIVIRALDAVAHVVLKMTEYVMRLAPLAAFAAVTAVLSQEGPKVLVTYGKFIITFYAGILILWLLLLLGASLFIGKRAFQLAGKVKDTILLAFSTASSESAFPRLLYELQEFGCPGKIVSFVLPLGYSFNLDGSMLYMTFASLFIAQTYGVAMDISQQITMLLVLMLTSKGIAGVPRASLVVIAGTLSMFHIPQQGLLLLLGMDQVLDMARSATNVLGNSLATAVISKIEATREERITKLAIVEYKEPTH